MNNLGFALFQTGDAAQARELYEKALALQPEFPEALNNLGIFYGTAARSRSRARLLSAGGQPARHLRRSRQQSRARARRARRDRQGHRGAAAAASGEPGVRDGLRDAVPHLSQGRPAARRACRCWSGCCSAIRRTRSVSSCCSRSAPEDDLAEVMSHDAVAPPIPSVAGSNQSGRRHQSARVRGGASGRLLSFPGSASTGSDIGSLYPFVQQQADRSPLELSFLQDKFTDLAAWQPTARATVLEHLSYAPPPVPPAAEIMRREDRGDYVQEYLTFQTTPDIRVPAYVLIPKKRNIDRRPASSHSTATAASMSGARTNWWRATTSIRR